MSDKKKFYLLVWLALLSIPVAMVMTLRSPICATRASQDPFALPPTGPMATRLDFRTLPIDSLKIKDRTPLSEYESRIQSAVLARASSTEVALLMNGARRSVALQDLLFAPERFRGEIVGVTGILRRVRGPIRNHPKGNGIDSYYEGWLLTRSQVVCIVFSELPADLEVGEWLVVEVSFAGYFFKILEYQAVDGNSQHVPLFLGRSPRRLSTRTAHSTS